MTSTVATESYDIVVLGGGSAAEWVWRQVKGKSIAIIEENRVGGECTYVACMPSKAMLHSAHSRRLMSRAKELGATAMTGHAGEPGAAYRSAAKRRDRIAEHRN